MIRNIKANITSGMVTLLVAMIFLSSEYINAAVTQKLLVISFFFPFQNAAGNADTDEYGAETCSQLIARVDLITVQCHRSTVTAYRHVFLMQM